MSRSTFCRRALLAFAMTASTSAALLTGPASAATTTPLGVNLVRDPGAEQADPSPDGGSQTPIAKWDLSGNFTAATYHPNPLGYPTRHESARIKGGLNFFSCGPDDANATAEQVVALFGRMQAIDAGRLRLNLSARIASHDHEGDAGRVKVWMLDAANSVIGMASTSWVKDTGARFVLRSRHKPLVPGTRKLEIVLEGLRNPASASGYCDAYFDNIKVTLAAI